MNTKSVVISGLVAGLVLNIGVGALLAGVIAEQSAAAMTALGKDIASSPTGMIWLVTITFLQGLIGMWLYATSTERGRGRAIAIGLVLWLLSGVYSAIYFFAGYPGLLPNDVVWIPVAWELVQYPLAMVIGAMAYKEK